MLHRVRFKSKFSRSDFSCAPGRTQRPSQSKPLTNAEQADPFNIRSSLDSQAILSVIDQSGRFIHVNQKFCDACEFSAEELIGSPIDLLQGSHRSPSFHKMMWQTLKRGNIWRGKIEIQTRSGASIWLDTINFPGQRQNGVILEYVSIQHQLAALGDDDNALLSREALLNSICEIANVSGWSFDLETEQRYLTYKAFDLFASIFGPDRVPPTEWLDIFDPDIRRELYQARERSLRDGVRWTKDVSLQNVTGESVWLRLFGGPRFIGDKVVGLVGAALDITNMKKDQEALERALHAAEAANHAKSRFLANMSHEIRTPLNGILGILGILSAAGLDSHNQKLVSNAEISGTLLLTIVNEILDVSRLESGQVSIEFLTASPRSMVAEIVSIMNTAAVNANNILTFDVADHVPMFLVTDWTRLRQIAINLVGNAVKFTKNGNVHLVLDGTPKAGDEFDLHLEVRDSGIGIDIEAQRTIFDEFTQADGSISRKFGGTGLGLAICRRLAHLLSGKIDFESAPGQGSRFWVDIPTKIPQAKDANPQPDRNSPLNMIPMRILIAEDNAINQIVIKHMMTRLGHYCDVVANGREAIAAVLNAPYDLILMDAQMPELDGQQAIQHIRNLERDERSIPIIVVTADAFIDDQTRYLANGADGYVAKPIDLIELALEMNRVVPSKIQEPQLPLVLPVAERHQGQPPQTESTLAKTTNPFAHISTKMIEL